MEQVVRNEATEDCETAEGLYAEWISLGIQDTNETVDAFNDYRAAVCGVPEVFVLNHKLYSWVDCY